ncbi:MAG TPA: polysaccharide deacetylase family protein, partial [Chloroflexia bacterium]|nr:polysaccharide deacetylase family protein [Chloroflexia bacterium]
SLSLACDSTAPPPTPVPSPIITVAAATEVPSPVPPTVLPTETLAPPTQPPALPSDTPVPPTEASVPPTETEVPPTETTTPPPDTMVPVANTATAMPPTRRPVTRTPLPPRSTATRVPAAVPSATRGTTGTPAAQVTAAPNQTRIAGDYSQVEWVPAGKGRIALTFDAGSTRGRVPDILDALARYDAHVTFFITGAWAEENPDMVRAIVAAGHEVANHSYSHPEFTKLSDEKMRAELDRCEAIIQSVAGVSTKPYWRPPFGDENRHVLDVTKAHGYRSIYWTWDSLDSVGKPKTKDFIVKRVTEPVVPLDGAIMLQHVAADPSIEALPEILNILYSQKHLRVVTISELLAP